MENFTIILLTCIGTLTLWNAIIWNAKGFLNIIVKVAMVVGTLLSINLILVAVGVVAEAVVPINFYMWVNAIGIGLLGLTWRSTGGLNIFLKFVHSLIAVACAVWLMIF